MATFKCAWSRLRYRT